MCVGMLASEAWQLSFFSKHWYMSHCFLASKCLILSVMVCWQAQKCVRLKCVRVFPRRTPQAIITVASYSLRIQSVTICQSPCLHWRLAPSNHICSVASLLNQQEFTPSSKTWLWAFCCNSFVFKEGCLLICKDIYKASSQGQDKAFFYGIITTVNLWTYFYSAVHIHTHAVTLAGLQCMSLTIEDLDAGIGSLCKISL